MNEATTVEQWGVIFAGRHASGVQPQHRLTDKGNCTNPTSILSCLELQRSARRGSYGSAHARRADQSTCGVISNRMKSTQDLN
jgi:hypothetical protein